MHAPRRILVSLALLTLVVVGAAPWRALPSCVLGKWEGITPTDPDGNLMGPADTGDWGCLGGGLSTFSAPRADVVPPPPTATCLQPAAPNPTSGSTRLVFSLVSASHVSVVVYGKKGNGPHHALPVRTLVDQDLATGTHAVLWDGNDNAGARVPPDLYRVVLVVDGGAVCGDIEVR